MYSQVVGKSRLQRTSLRRKSSHNRLAFEPLENRLCLAVIPITPAWIASRGAGPYSLTSSDSTYILDTDVTTNGSAFVFAGKNITLDLAGHTITYNNGTPVAVANGGFETGTGANWDLSHSPHASIVANTNQLYGNKVLDYSDVFDSEYIVSDPIAIPVANQEYTATVTPSRSSGTETISIIDAVTGNTLASDSATNNQLCSVVSVSFTPETTHAVKIKISTTAVVSLDYVTLSASHQYGIVIGRDRLPSQLSYVKNLPTASNSTITSSVGMGRIVQGQGNGWSSSVFYADSAVGLTVSNIQAVVSGQDTNVVRSIWGSNFDIHDNTFTSTSDNVSQRDRLDLSGGALISVAASYGTISIKRNTLLGSPQQGIFAGNNGNSNDTIAIQDNTIQSRNIVANGYGIEVNEAFKFVISGNTITAGAGQSSRGILLDNKDANGEVYGNYVDVHEVFNREYDQNSGGDTSALKIRTWDEVDQHDIFIHDNTFIARTFTGEPLGAIGLRYEYSANSVNVNLKYRIENNTFAAYNQNVSESAWAAAISLDKVAEHGSANLKNNILESNNISLALGGNDNGGIDCLDGDFISNTFRKSTIGQAVAYHSVVASNYFYEAVHNVMLIDSRYEGGATSQIYWEGSETKDVSTGWLLSVQTQDTLGAALAGATVRVLDKSGGVVFSGVSNANGVVNEIPVATTIYRQPGDNPAVITTELRNPFTIQVSLAGFLPFSQTISLDQSESILVQLHRDSVATAVMNRRIFYNNSVFDDPAFGKTDDDAIAADKQALLPGQTATFINYSSYIRGINGIFVDIDNLADPASLSSADFQFRMGNDDYPDGWSDAPTPSSISVRMGAGVNGSARVTLIWTDGAIVNQWLEVTVKATASTGLAAPDIFYFGNAIGESGDSAFNAVVDAQDEQAVIQHVSGSQPETIVNLYDFNRDSWVNSTDAGIARDYRTDGADAFPLLLITPQSGFAAMAVVVNRQLFYNNSVFDNPARGKSDDDAIAVDKQALLTGQRANFYNYSSYNRGINGIFVDIDNLAKPANLTAADFEFRLGNNNNPGGWADAPLPVSISIRRRAGVDGSARVTLIWADGAIVNRWLQVTVKATSNTGLVAPDVFYFGNAIGESGDSYLNAMVNAQDEQAVIQNKSGFQSEAIINAFDFNRDGWVNAADAVIARDHRTDGVGAISLNLITPPYGGYAGAHIVIRLLFYNNSVFDDPALGRSDDFAFAGDKQPLVPGQTATFYNYSSYSRGINGIFVDIENLADPVNLSAADFQFRVGNDNNPAGWNDAPAPTSVSVRWGDGFSGSARVSLIWADGAIVNQWLEVTVKATANTGLTAPDVFYFGNAVGESGSDALNAVVDAQDEQAVLQNKSGFQPEPITNLYDFNRDRWVNSTDAIIARDYRTDGPGAHPLLLITPSLGNSSASTATTQSVGISDQKTSRKLSVKDNLHPIIPPVTTAFLFGQQDETKDWDIKPSHRVSIDNSLVEELSLKSVNKRIRIPSNPWEQIFGNFVGEMSLFKLGRVSR
jgi:hypothetical protein